jgi:hypothetical protein
LIYVNSIDWHYEMMIEFGKVLLLNS